MGYETEYFLKDGLNEMIDWIKKRGTRPFDYHLDIEIMNEKTPETWLDKLM